MSSLTGSGPAQESLNLRARGLRVFARLIRGREDIIACVSCLGGIVADTLGIRRRTPVPSNAGTKQRPVMMLLPEGGTSGYKAARFMLDDPPQAKYLPGDRGHDADGFREGLEDKGVEPCIPPGKNRSKSRAVIRVGPIGIYSVVQAFVRT